MKKEFAKTTFAFALLAVVTSGCAEGYHDQSPYTQSAASSYDGPQYSGYSYYSSQCQRDKHDRNVAGIALGALAGGLIGNAVSSGGGKTGGTIIGAAAGAAVGSNVARSSINCDNGRPYWTREQTADYDSYQGYRGQRDDTWYRQHDCRWVRSDRSEYVRVCRGSNDKYYPEY
jgi:outer membrane lipoprotein SlyB